MKELIEALTIFLKYGDHGVPTHGEHGIFIVVGYTEAEISQADLIRLDELHFRWDDSEEHWCSSFFGSA